MPKLVFTDITIRGLKPGTYFDTTDELERNTLSGVRKSLPAIVASARNEPLPLSFAQQRLWFLDQMEGVTQAHHVVRRLQLTGELDGVVKHNIDDVAAQLAGAKDSGLTNLMGRTIALKRRACTSGSSRTTAGLGLTWRTSRKGSLISRE